MLHFPHRAGNYVLFAELGSGPVSTTYIGRGIGHARAGFKPLALRILQPHLSQRPDVVRVFLDEQRAAALLLHPRIATVYEVGVLPDGNYFSASEYVHGVPLREVQRTVQAQLTPAQAVHVSMQLCDALHYAHERLDVTGKPLRIVHGQLSPDAVILGFDGNAKVTEFGLLRTRDAAAATIPTLLQRRTAFLSPELRAQLPLRVAPQLDRRTDVYSLGALLWEMLTGESLVPTEDGAPPPPPSKVRPVDPALDAIVMRAIAKAPADRFPSAQALRLALSGVGHALVPDGTGSLATGLARSLTVAFRERMLAFQEQVDLWRKFEDEVLPEGERRATGEAPRGPSNSSGNISLRRTGLSGSGVAVGVTGSIGASGAVSGLPAVPATTPLPGQQFNPLSQSHPSLPRGIPTPLPGAGPGATPLPGAGLRDAAALKGRLFVVLLFLAIAGIVSGTAVLILRPRAPVQETAAFLVDSQPRGAEIFVDGRPAGNTPHRIAELSLGGPLRIEVRKEGYRPWVREVTPKAGQTISLEAELEQVQ